MTAVHARRLAAEVAALVGVSPLVTPEWLARQIEASEQEAGAAITEWAGGDYLYSFDQCICFLHALRLSLERGRSRCGKPYLLAPLALSGSAALQAAAIRRLTLSGFMVCARPLVRVLHETLDLVVVTSYEPAFAEAYHHAADPQAFWEKHVGYGRLSKRIKAIHARTPVLGLPSDDVWTDRAQRRRSLSESVHPSFSVAAFGTYAIRVEERPMGFRHSLTGQSDRIHLPLLLDCVAAIADCAGTLLAPVVHKAKRNQRPAFVQFLSVEDVRALILHGTTIFNLEQVSRSALAANDAELDRLMGSDSGAGFQLPLL